ncbi:MAG: CRISPR-associated protein Cas5 [Candidatus Micrarchaeota archaeon]
MLDKILSFKLAGEFAAFRDPSVTSNQTVYFIPSKSAVIGVLGAVLGVERGQALDEDYGAGYRRLLAKTMIGIKPLSFGQKIAFSTNHRSLKEAKTKPFKTELLEKPGYEIFVKSDSETMARLYDELLKNRAHFTPHLGHAYCIGRLDNPVLHSVKLIEPSKKFFSSSVVMDECQETQIPAQALDLSGDDGSRIIIERHLHHFIQNGDLKKKVLRFWIPVEGKIRVEHANTALKLTSFYELDDKRTICMF